MKQRVPQKWWQEPVPLHWSAVAAGIMLALATVFALASLIDPTETTSARVARTGVVRIGYAVEAPFAFLGKQGRVTGESPEVARAVWRQLGVVRIEWVQTDFASLIPQLRAGRFDQIASGLSIRPDREGLVAFTSPSICLKPALLVRRGNPLHLHSFADIGNHDGVRLAVLAGAVEGEDAARAGIPSDRIIAYPNPDLALRAMRLGLADALTLSAPTVQRLADAHPDMQRAIPFEHNAFVDSGCAAFAFRRSDKQLRDRFDRALRALIGSPEHLQLIQPFGLGPEELPVPASETDR